MKASIKKQKNKRGRHLIVLSDEQIAKVEELSAYLNLYWV